MSMIIKEKELVAEKLAELASANGGRLTPNLVLEEAEDPDSVLHSLFEWDDTLAARQHRIFQARQIITSVRVVITTENKKISTVYYVRDPDAEPLEQGYVSIDRLRTDKDLARESIVMEFSRASSYLQRAKAHAQALNLNDEIEELIDNINEFKRRLDI